MVDRDEPPCRGPLPGSAPPPCWVRRLRVVTGVVQYPRHIYSNRKWIRLSNLLQCCTSFPVSFVLYWYVSFYLLSAHYFGWPMPPGYLFYPFYTPCSSRPSHPSMSSPSCPHSPVPILKPMGIVIFCFSLSLFCPCPFPVDCLAVLDLMKCPRHRPLVLFPIVNAFFLCCVVVFLHCVLGLSTCFPQEGRLHQYPRPC
jgi:hypothetical protein